MKPLHPTIGLAASASAFILLLSYAPSVIADFVLPAPCESQLRTMQRQDVATRRAIETVRTEENALEPLRAVVARERVAYNDANRTLLEQFPGDQFSPDQTGQNNYRLRMAALALIQERIDAAQSRVVAQVSVVGSAFSTMRAAIEANYQAISAYRTCREQNGL
jgi:hypothetical protein